MAISPRNPTDLASVQRTFFGTGATLPYEFRMQQLELLERLFTENTDALCTALYQDLRKPKQESLIAEIALVLEEVRIARKKLKGWIKPRKQGTPLALWPARSRTYFEPMGCVLIVGPWNYPVQLAFAPLVGALAAGCCAILKPSELAPHCSALFSQLVAKYFKPEVLTVFEGAIPETTALLEINFDYIFFTGSTPVGRVVMQAAAKNLTPVTLELGGKSPAIVAEDADLDLAARRIVWGKFYNAGQTCVAPDYLYVHEQVREAFLAKLHVAIDEQFGTDPQKSESYARIINSRNLQRLIALIDPEKIHQGGKSDEKDLYLQPTLLTGVAWSDPVMKEEIFGPVLPVFGYSNLAEVFGTINSHPKPLAAYFFSHSTDKQDQFIQSIAFGGGCINDVLLHLGNPNLPFGGVGGSGMGSYHGEKSFLTFSHAKSVMLRGGFLDVSARYAPYTEAKTKFMRRIFKV